MRFSNASDDDSSEEAAGDEGKDSASPIGGPAGEH